jgi:uncharacterized protein YceK
MFRLLFIMLCLLLSGCATAITDCLFTGVDELKSKHPESNIYNIRACPVTDRIDIESDEWITSVRYKFIF